MSSASLVAVERDRTVAQQLKKNAEQLKANQSNIICADVLNFLQGQPEPFDLVFIDPPFRKNLIQPTLDLLAPWLAPNAWVYLETESELVLPLLPEQWQLYRDKVAGQFHSYLFQVC